MHPTPLDKITNQIKLIMHDARVAASLELNNQVIITYWEIGHVIVDYEQNGNVRAQYGAQLLAELSKELTRELGKGFSRSNLQNMRNLFLFYPDFDRSSADPFENLRI